MPSNVVRATASRRECTAHEWLPRGSSEHLRELSQFVADDAAVAELDDEPVSGGALLGEDRPRAEYPHADLPDGRAGGCGWHEDDRVAITGMEQRPEHAAGLPTHLSHLAGPDEEGEVAGGRAVVEVASPTFGEGDLDGAVRVEAVGPTVPVAGLDLATVEGHRESGDAQGEAQLVAPREHQDAL